MVMGAYQEIFGDKTMAQLLTVPRTEWTRFFDRISESLLGKRAEMASLDLGDQIVAEWVPMLGITYDSKNDLVDVALDRVDHLIRRPREVVVDQGATGVSSVAIVDADGARQSSSSRTR
jgi:hypothetical protein